MENKCRPEDVANLPCALLSMPLQQLAKMAGNGWSVPSAGSVIFLMLLSSDTKKEQLSIPDDDKELQLRLLAVAHQGPAGHRGRDVTYQAISGHCVWTCMQKDTAAFVRNCLQCIKDHTGGTVPRPLGTQLQAEKFNKVIHVDFCELGPSDTGHLYVLVAKGGLTQFVQLTIHKSATALDAAVGLLDWFKTFGIPSVIVSDGGPHFKNSLIQLLARELTFEHHLTLATLPGPMAALSASTAVCSLTSASR